MLSNKTKKKKNKTEHDFHVSRNRNHVNLSYTPIFLRILTCRGLIISNLQIYYYLKFEFE